MNSDSLPPLTLAVHRAPIEGENVGRGFLLSFGGHALVVAGLVLATWLGHRLNPHWGEADPTVGSVQASMVNALPLPPKQRTLDKAVLTSEKPSLAPTPPPPAPAAPVKATPLPPKAEPLPKPHEILLPAKATPMKPAPKVATREQPVATNRPLPAPAPTPKATTGETAGVQIPQSVSQLKNGTASVTVEERAFGDRYAYYVRLISQKINQSKQQESDGPEAKGKKTVIHFVIDRDGAPTEVQVATRSGSSALDTSTLRAIQRIDSFGPLPMGDHLPVTFVYDAR